MKSKLASLHLLLLSLLLCFNNNIDIKAKTLNGGKGKDEQRYKVACCDWMLLKRQKLGEFKLSHEIGADGVELDMGPLGKRVLFDNQLRSEKMLNKFIACDGYDIQIPSIAMSGFYAQNFIKRSNYKALIYDCLNFMGKFPDTRIAYLPLGGSGQEWKHAGAERDTLVARLRWAGDAAAQRGMVIAIRTSLSASDNIKLLKEVGSCGIKIYYSVQDAVENNRDISTEIKELGRKRIAQIHISNTDGVLLKDDPAVNMPAVKQALDNIGWRGWLVVERSRDHNKVRNVRYNYGNNVAYLKDIFQK